METINKLQTGESRTQIKIFIIAGVIATIAVLIAHFIFKVPIQIN